MRQAVGSSGAGEGVMELTPDAFYGVTDDEAANERPFLLERANISESDMDALRKGSVSEHLSELLARAANLMPGKRLPRILLLGGLTLLLAGCGAAANNSRSGVDGGAASRQATAAGVLNNSFLAYEVTCPDGGLPVVSDSSVKPGSTSIANGGDLGSIGALMCMYPDGNKYGGSPVLKLLAPDAPLSSPDSGMLGVFCLKPDGSDGAKPNVQATAASSPTPDGGFPSLTSLQASCPDTDGSLKADMVYSSPDAAKSAFSGL